MGRAEKKGKRRRRTSAKPHRFGEFNVRGIKVVNWRLPDNADEDVVWGYERLSDKRKR